MHVELREIDRPRRQPAGRAGLEAVDAKAEGCQCQAHPRRRPLPCPSAGNLRLAGVHHRLQEGACGEDDRPGVIFRIATDANAHDPPHGTFRRVPFLDDEVIDCLLPQVEALDLLDNPLHLHLVELLVGLRSGAVHGRPLGSIQHTELDAGSVDGAGHHATEGVDLPHELRLPHAADGRVAAHLADGVAVGREKGCLRSQPGCRAGRLHAGVAGPDHDHVVVVAGGHGTLGQRKARGSR